jgi:hypothetical protein
MLSIHQKILSVPRFFVPDFAPRYSSAGFGVRDQEIRRAGTSRLSGTIRQFVASADILSDKSGIFAENAALP